jgi:YfiH family protein
MTPPFETADNLFAIEGIRHGFFGRRGGGSSGDFAANNVSFSVGDDEDVVAGNQRGCLVALGLGPSRLTMVRQVHSARVHVATPDAETDAIEADALVTTSRGLALGILTADCTPILLADPEAGVVAAAHAGWRGAVDGVVENTIATMLELGAEPGRIRAAIGPTISGANYEVGTAFANDLLAQAPHAAAHLFTPPGGKPHFALPDFVREKLNRAGIASIESVGGCTYAHPDRYFSHRFATHQGTRAGRQIAIIALV